MGAELSINLHLSLESDQFFEGLQYEISCLILQYCNKKNQYPQNISLTDLALKRKISIAQMRIILMHYTDKRIFAPTHFMDSQSFRLIFYVIDLGKKKWVIDHIDNVESFQELHQDFTKDEMVKFYLVFSFYQTLSDSQKEDHLSEMEVDYNKRSFLKGLPTNIFNILMKYEGDPKNISNKEVNSLEGIGSKSKKMIKDHYAKAGITLDIGYVY